MRARGQSRQAGAHGRDCSRKMIVPGHLHRLGYARVPGLLPDSCRLAPAQQASDFLFEFCQAVARKIWSHSDDDIACLRKLFPVQTEGLAEQPLYAVTPHGWAGFALHADAQTAGVCAIRSGDNTKSLAVPPFPLLVDLLKFTVQMQAHPSGKGAASGHGSGRQLFAAFGPSSSDNGPAGTGAHANKKTVGAGACGVAGLKSSFTHNNYPL